MPARRFAGEDPRAGLVGIGPIRIDHALRLDLDDSIRFLTVRFDRTALDDAFGFEFLRVALDRVPSRPVFPRGRIGVTLFGALRIIPSGLRLTAEVQHVVVVRVPADAHRDQLDQRRAAALARPFGGPRERAGNRFRIGPVQRQARNPVPERLVGEHAHGALIARRRGQRGLVVLHAEDRGQPARGAEVDRLVPLAERGSALADERDRDALLAAEREGHRQAGHRHRRDAQRRGGRQDAPGEISDVEVLPVHRRPGLAGLRVEHHAHRLRGGPHGQRGPGVADQRRDDVAGPAPAPVPIARSAPQSKRSGVDRLLAQRAEALALEALPPVTHLAPEEQVLELVVDGPGEDHAAQHLAPLLAGQGGGDLLAAQEAADRLNHLVRRLLHPLRGGDPRCRLRAPVEARGGECVPETLHRFAVAGLRRFAEHGDDPLRRPGEPFGHEGDETAKPVRIRLRLVAFTHARPACPRGTDAARPSAPTLVRGGPNGQDC